MLLAALVVFREALLQRVADQGGGQAVRRSGGGGPLPLSPFPLSRDVFCRRLQRLQRPPRIAVRFARQQGQRVVVDREPQGTQPAVSVLQRAAHHGRDVVCGERLQHEHAAARQQRPGELEARVLGGRADQGDDPVLDPREEGILLGSVEAVDLVTEEDRSEEHTSELQSLTNLVCRLLLEKKKKRKKKINKKTVHQLPSITKRNA